MMNKFEYRIVITHVDEAENIANAMAKEGWRVVNVTSLGHSHDRVWLERMERRK